MKSPPILLLAAVSGILCACLPSQDNANDPIHLANARLVVADWSPSGGACPATPPAAGLDPTSAAPIGHCLVLDARQTTAPGGSSGLSYRFAGPGLTTTSSGGAAFMILPDATRLALPLGQLLTFTVTVRAPDGGETSAQASVVLSDQPPSVVAGDELSLPAGGFPWAPGPFQVRFQATGDSPDHDPLRYCWTLPPAAETCSTSGQFTATFSTAEQFAVASVRTFDGISYSLPQSQTLVIRERAQWVKGAGALSRLDTGRVDLGTSGSALGASYAEAAGGPLIARITTASGIQLYDGNTFAAGVPAASGVTAVSEPVFISLLDGPRGRAWLAGVEENPSNNLNIVAQSWLAGPGPVLTPELPYTSVSGNQVVTFQIYDATVPVAVVASNGALWISRIPQDTEIDTISPGGTISSWQSGDASTVSGLASRPGTGEVWAAMEAGTNGAELVRFSPDGTSTVIPFPAGSAEGIAFADIDRVWVGTEDLGLMLLDVETLLTPGTPPAAAILLTLPQVIIGTGDTNKLSADPRTGACFLPGFKVAVNGTVTPIAGSDFVQGFTPEDEILFDLGADLLLGLSPGSGGIAAQSPIAATGQAGFDWTTGGTWSRAPINFSYDAMVRLDDRGFPTASFGTAVLGTAEAPIESMAFDFEVAPGTQTIWATAHPSALTGEPTRLEAFRTQDAAGQLSLPVEVVFTSLSNTIALTPLSFLAPLAAVNSTSGQQAWIGIGPKVHLLDARTVSDTVLFTAPEPITTSGASSPRSNELCLVTHTTASFPGGSPVLRRIGVDGSVRFQQTPAGTDAVASAAGDAAFDACWFVVDGTTVLAIAPDGLPLHTFTTTGVSSIAPLSDSAVLLTSAAGEVLVEFAPQVGGLMTSTRTVSTITGGTLLR